MQDFEKLGVFYLGRNRDAHSGELGGPLLYESSDLVTHAVCVGMTGSGKTGLCISLLEEAAIDGIPALVIDPKGDLPNLLLTFPQLRAEDFRPWINESDAARQGIEPDAFAAAQAELWRKGLADWGEDGERIRRLHEAADFTVFTPGSTAGMPLSMLKTFAAPATSIRRDGETLAELVGTVASGLLALAGIEADPIQSREHILISTLLADSWKAGRDLELPAIIAQIQEPPVKTIGVLDVESFYPAKERFALAMRLNNLLAAPGFSAWLEGEPLDVERLLHTPEGKPRISIFSIAHLDDAQRMFFVATLLEQVVGWMRTQTGTTSLRAIVYMDEIFGYFPPVANPPSKRPLLTLLKQARAYGVGVVLATQNPVDLDYKGLSNAGTWFLGRLQTERDQARVLDGLEGATSASGAAFNRSEVQQLLAGLQARVFLLNNVHQRGPQLFQVRWALSYLRGPMTREQIRRLMDERRKPRSAEGEEKKDEAKPPAPAPLPAASSAGAIASRPVLEPDVPQYFLAPPAGAPPGAKVVYRPLAVGMVQVHYLQAKNAVDSNEDVTLATAVNPQGAAVDWQLSAPIAVTRAELIAAPQGGGLFAPLASAACQAKSYKPWQKALVDYVYRTRRVKLWTSPALKLVSRVGESEGDFRVRVQQAAREWRDTQIEKARAEFAPKLESVQDRIHKAETALEREKAQASQKKVESFFSAGAAIIGMFLGRKKISATSVRRAGTATRSAGRAMGASRDVEEKEMTVDQLRARFTQLTDESLARMTELRDQAQTLGEALETISIAPKKADVTVSLMALVWQPSVELPAEAVETPAAAPAAKG